jgi:hypothetical protein
MTKNRENKEKKNLENMPLFDGRRASFFWYQDRACVLEFPWDLRKESI